MYQRFGYTAGLTVLCLMLIWTGAAMAGTIPDVTFELTTASSVPVSLYCRPDGSGVPFTAARSLGGIVDATITGILLDSGQPVANFPAEDMWLEASQGGLIICQGGTTADTATDAAGRTQWQTPLHVGGTLDPALGETLIAFVNGMPFTGPVLASYRLNSADINGDLSVNLSDVALFIQDLLGAYAYRSDFAWDAVINLSDVATFTPSLGTSCP